MASVVLLPIFAAPTVRVIVFSTQHPLEVEEVISFKEVSLISIRKPLNGSQVQLLINMDFSHWVL
jgi:hypothetical protein